MGKLLQVRNLRTVFYTENGPIRAVDDVSLSVDQGKTLGIVGESGCGKSVTALSLMRLIPDPPGRIESGSIIFRGKEILSLSEKEMQRIRGNEIAMIFQEPMTSLNPVFTIGYQILEAIRLHQNCSRKEAEKIAQRMLEEVGIGDARGRLREYPHQISGGMRQRVMIAMALSCKPDLIIADEPTTALDVTIQAQILELLRSLQVRYRMSIILISHNLGVIAGLAHHVLVMYAGQVVEESSTERLFTKPLHPYTQGLIASIPNPMSWKTGRYLSGIPGSVPTLTALPQGCRFQDRCGDVIEVCRNRAPDLVEVGEDHRVRCWKYKS
nr:ABC transporter ATP-binding protein [Desulfobacterales bacterium]